MKGTPSLSSPSHHDPLPPAQAVLGGPGGGKQSPEGSEGGALELGRQQQPCSQDPGRQGQGARQGEAVLQAEPRQRPGWQPGQLRLFGDTFLRN